MYVRSIRHCNTLPCILVCVTAAALLPALAKAAQNSKNPTSKFYVADVEGDAQIDTGEKVDDLNKQSVYNAQGTVIETKANSVNAMVFSNGTGIFFDSDTRVEMKRFEQEPSSRTAPTWIRSRRCRRPRPMCRGARSAFARATWWPEAR